MYRADEYFMDIIADRCDAVFLSPDSLDKEDYEMMNESFIYGEPLVIFTEQPEYRLKFRYYLVNMDNEQELKNCRKCFETIRKKHLQESEV